MHYLWHRLRQQPAWISATNRADYIRFSGREAIQRERREMMLERFRTRAALREYWDTQLSTDPRFAGAGTFDDFILIVSRPPRPRLSLIRQIVIMHTVSLVVTMR